MVSPEVAQEITPDVGIEIIPNSELQVSKEQAFEALKKLEEKYEEVVDAQDPHRQEVFDYECPFCNGVNLLSCYYFSNSQAVKSENFAFDMDWLILYSKRKPYYLEE